MLKAQEVSEAQVLEAQGVLEALEVLTAVDLPLYLVPVRWRLCWLNRKLLPTQI